MKKRKGHENHIAYPDHVDHDEWIAEKLYQNRIILGPEKRSAKNLFAFLAGNRWNLQ